MALAEGQNSRVAGFVAAGYQYMECVVLALEADRWRPAGPGSAARARPSAPTTGTSGSPSSWMSGMRAHSEESYLPYLRSRRHLYEAMIADGWAVVGIWHQDRLIASCGLFFTGTMGRFQLGAHPQAWRNQGFCRQLLSQVAHQG